MMLVEIEELLKQRMGLDPASIGSATIERAVRLRLAASGLEGPGEYAELLRDSETEFQELIEAVVVPETWFFRDREAFAALALYVRIEWLPAHPGESLRLLSVPCATGEEPYSVAMALLDAGLLPNQFHIDAVDISARAIERARRGVYGKGSFRGPPGSFRDRFFEPASPGLRLAEAVRLQVSFLQGNLLDPRLWAGHSVYHVLFCRNLLIYFDRPTQDQTVGVIQRLLAPDGRLFVGPAETGLMLSHGLDSIKYPLAFAFRNPPPPPKAARELSPAKRKTVHSRASSRLSAQPAVARLPNSRPQPLVSAASPPTQPKTACDLDSASRLGDAGRLIEAAAMCENYLQAHGPSARAFYLLGLLRDAAGDMSKASEHYRKALYLEPNHSEALTHLALLTERMGDRAGARVLHQRARRAGKGSVTSDQ